MRRFFLSILLVVVLSLSAIPRPAHAIIPVLIDFDASFQAFFHWMKENVFDTVLGRALARNLAHQFINNTSEWLRRGGKGGGPLYVTNFDRFVKNAANEASGEFIENLGLSELLCSPFRLQLDIALQGYQSNRFDHFDCTLEDVVDNVEGFYDDFSRGGWDAWAELSRPRNTLTGEYLLALDGSAEAGRRASTQANAWATISGGLLGVERCEEVPVERKGKEKDLPEDIEITETVCTTVTPGEAVHGAMEQVTGKDLDWLISTDEMGELVVALADFTLQSLFDEAGSDSPSGLYDRPQREGNSGNSASFGTLKNFLRSGASKMHAVVSRTESLAARKVFDIRNDRPKETVKDEPGCHVQHGINPIIPESCYIRPPEGCSIVDATGNGIIECGPVVRLDADGNKVDGDTVFKDLQASALEINILMTVIIPDLQNSAELEAKKEEMRTAFNLAVSRIQKAKIYLSTDQIEEVDRDLNAAMIQLRETLNVTF